MPENSFQYVPERRGNQIGPTRTVALNPRKAFPKGTRPSDQSRPQGPFFPDLSGFERWKAPFHRQEVLKETPYGDLGRRGRPVLRFALCRFVQSRRICPFKAAGPVHFLFVKHVHRPRATKPTPLSVGITQMKPGRNSLQPDPGTSVPAQNTETARCFQVSMLAMLRGCSTGEPPLFRKCSTMPVLDNRGKMLPHDSPANPLCGKISRPRRKGQIRNRTGRPLR